MQAPENPDILLEELQNLEEIGRFLNPSPGEIPKLDGIEIGGFSRPLQGVLGGDHLLYIDFQKRYDLEFRVELTPRLESSAREVDLTARIFGIDGVRVDTIYENDARTVSAIHDPRKDRWDGRGPDGRPVPGGIYILSVVSGEGLSRFNKAFSVVR